MGGGHNHHVSLFLRKKTAQRGFRQVAILARWTGEDCIIVSQTYAVVQSKNGISVADFICGGR